MSAKGLPTEPAERRLVPPFTEEHEELRASLRRFVEGELRPHAQEWERERWVPNEMFARMGELGFFGLEYPEEYGGQGGDCLHSAVLAEEMARCGSGGVAASLGAHVTIATPPVWKFGTEDQKQRYVVPSIRGEKISALGITEPGAGSDVASLRTSAKRVDGATEGEQLEGWPVGSLGVAAHITLLPQHGEHAENLGGGFVEGPGQVGLAHGRRRGGENFEQAQAFGQGRRGIAGGSFRNGHVCKLHV